MSEQKPHHRKTLGDLGYTEEWSPFSGQGDDGPDAPVARRHYGKHRGTVINNEDPYFQGRLMVTVPGIVISNWAMPCVPLTDISMGTYVRPRIGANVWVEFEAGDPDYPILAGCFWADGEVPASPAVETTKVLKTDGITLTISDTPGGGGVTIEVNPPVVSAPLKMVFDNNGIELSNGKSTVKLTAASVSINNGALEVI